MRKELKKLLVVCHAPSPNTRSLCDAAVRGAQYEGLENTQAVWVPPLQAGVEDVLNCDAILLGTTENFGYMSGALKDFFDRIYYPCLERTEAKPFVYYVRAGNDGSGACRAIDTITTGLCWRQVLPPVVCKGAFDPGFIAQVEELSATLCAGVESGLY